jgi:hypothetical protein
MCWFQGESDSSLPPLNRECIKRWRELNPDWKVNVLSQRTISNYIPEFFDIVKISPWRSFAAQSDLLRLLLLEKYGGVWVDASAYPMIPLSDFYDKIVNNTGFFTYRFFPRRVSFKVGHRETVSWFICVDKPNHYIIEKWKTKFITEFKNNKHWKYFTFHETLTDLYGEDRRVKYIIENMIQISADIPHSAIPNWENRKDSYMYKRPKLFSVK